MRHIVEAGTDAAGVALFDPGALPEDFDLRMQDDPIGFLERLQQDGKAFYTETGGDGRYLLHAYVDEPIPSNLEDHLRDPITIERFSILTGHLYFTGSEYAFRDDDSLLRRYPHMGGSLAVPAGEYRLTIRRAEYPPNHLEKLLRSETGAAAFLLHQSLGWFVILAIAAVPGLVFSYFAMARNEWLWYVVPAAVVLLALPFLVVRLGPYREARDRFKAIGREHPNIVARLEKLANG
jgi:hypothetical protein